MVVVVDDEDGAEEEEEAALVCQIEAACSQGLKECCCGCAS